MALRILTLDELLALATALAQAQVDRRVHPEAAVRYGLITALLNAAGIPAPEILSGFRTLSFQRGLYDAWRSGNLANKPASRSWHTRGLAFDLTGTPEQLDLFGALWAALGGRRGADFSTPDRNHFDFPVNGLEPEAAF